MTSRRRLGRRAMLGRSAVAAAGSALGIVHVPAWGAPLGQGPPGLENTAHIRRVVTGHNA